MPERTEIMSRHLTLEGALDRRDRLDQTVCRVATGGDYYVLRSWLCWKVVKRYEVPR